VALPREAFGEPVGDDVLLGRAAPAPADAGPPDGRAARSEPELDRASPHPSPLRCGEGGRQRRVAPAPRPSAESGSRSRSEPKPSAHHPPSLVRVSGARERELARALCAARGLAVDEPSAGDETLAAGEAMSEALREVRELLEEGQSPARVAAAIASVGRRRARAVGTEAT
jgi:hypothetical protein